MLSDNRMKRIYATVRTLSDRGVCDVGTDHAFIPIELVRDGRVSFAVATDISLPSVRKGEKNIAENGLADKISTHCANGTLGVPLDGIGDIIIAGMGGELIAEILSADPRLRDSALHFVLQPMTKQPELRDFLVNNGFLIEKEYCERDGDRIYFIMSVYYKGFNRPISLRDSLLGVGTEDDRNLFEYAKKLRGLLGIRLEGLRVASDSALYTPEMLSINEKLAFLDSYISENDSRFRPPMRDSKDIPYTFIERLRQ